MISEEEKQRVREATDLAALVGETVVLRPRGADLWGCCPFHHEKSPSFHVIPSRGLWHCFGCGKGGDCIGFVMERDHLEFPDAVRLLAERAGIELAEDAHATRGRGSSSKRSRLYEAMEAAVDFFHQQLTRVRGEGPDRARAYLAGRGMGIAVADQWGLGYAPGSGAMVRELTRRGFTRQELIDAKLASVRDGQLRDTFWKRVTIPIRDERGRCVAIGARSLDGSDPKYLNSAESPIYSKSRTVFGLDRAKSHITAQMEAVLVEGYFDVIAPHLAGIENVVAPLGTALTGQQVKTITRFLTASGDKVSRGRIVCLFDGDAAGLSAAEKALRHVGSTTAAMYCVALTGAKDPDEFLRTHGADELRGLIASAEPLARFVIDRHLARFDLTTPEGRATALADVVQAMAPLKGTPLADEYTRYVADRLMADPTTVRAALAKVAPPPAERDEDERDPLLEHADQMTLDQGGPAPAPSVAPRAGALLPEDARMIRVEREVLSAMAAAPDAARAYAERVASFSWADPRNEAIAWALLATPEGTDALGALAAAEAVVPEAAQILADGALALNDEGDDARALSILLDDLEIRSLRRQIDQGRAQLRSLGPSQQAEQFNELFQRLTAYQRRLKELEANMRSVK